MKGTIELDTVKKTITIWLENGSYCIDHYPNGIKRFLEEEFECIDAKMVTVELVKKLDI